jgi:hypothetical protein
MLWLTNYQLFMSFILKRKEIHPILSEYGVADLKTEDRII